MSIEDTVKNLISEVGATRAEILKADEARKDAFTQLRKDVETNSKSTGDTVAKLERINAEMSALVAKMQGFEAAIDSLSKKANRPGGSGQDAGVEVVRKSAIGLLEARHLLRVPKTDPLHPFAPTEPEIEEAALACKAMRMFMHSTMEAAHLPELERKALTAFQMGASGFILQPEMSARILSCLVDITDVTGLMANITISGPSIKFMVDDVRIMNAAWACETSCFANNPPAVLTDGLGEIELKPETLRYIVCASRDILEDASVDVESWMLTKVNWAFRNTISTAVLTGDGIGKPLGILNPAAGIPICTTGAGTPAGQLTWQDLIMLKWQVPMQFQGAGRYLMNQNTFALVLTMSDALGRPIMIAMPTDNGQFVINGSPVQVVTQMPDVAPGATPVAYGNWQQVYMIVNRKAVTMQQDPYSAGFCVLWKFEARVGGGVICPNAARLLRIV